MNRNLSPAARRRGFTLVELLVVIGIIALLVGILLPTLSSARDSAKTVACLSNQRQIGQGLVFYNNDWNGALPAMEVLNQPEGPAGRFWAWKLAEPGYLPLEPADSPEKVTLDTVFVCPAGDAEVSPNMFTAPTSQVDRKGAQLNVFDVPAANYDPGDPSTTRQVGISYAVNGTWVPSSDVVGADPAVHGLLPDEHHQLGARAGE